jgi:hypothetical protein
MHRTTWMLIALREERIFFLPGSRQRNQRGSPDDEAGRRLPASRLLQNAFVALCSLAMFGTKFLTARERAAEAALSSSHPATNAG